MSDNWEFYKGFYIFRKEKKFLRKIITYYAVVMEDIEVRRFSSLEKSKAFCNRLLRILLPS